MLDKSDTNFQLGLALDIAQSKNIGNLNLNIFTQKQFQFQSRLPIRLPVHASKKHRHMTMSCLRSYKWRMFLRRLLLLQPERSSPTKEA